MTPKEPDQNLLDVQEQFILEWGRMSSSWGINRTMAQIHALLLSSPEALTVDEIMDRLQISRGNASMSLRDLISWGVVRRFRKPGERRDLYMSEQDLLVMFARVIRERKRRELDPTVGAIRECISRLSEPGTSVEADQFRTRLNSLLEIFTILDAVYNQVFATDKALFETMRLFRISDQPLADSP